MKLTRNLFYNKRNGQASLTVPAKALKKLQLELNSKKPLKKISFEILKEVKL